MTGPQDIVAELKRRKVFRVAAAYLVVGWMVVEAAGLMFPVFGAPDWALRAFILVVLLGFPLALVLAWIFDVTPAGVNVTDSARSYRWLAVLPLLLAMLAVGWFARGPGGDEAPVAGPAVVADRSIAVLAFADLSAEQDQEYFADGIAEEILHALARMRELRVAGRTSSFQYKGRNEDLRQVGRALGVAHVLEGSVRRQGSRLRITAQLIRVADGFHLWSETYDADVADVFAVQERIARAIARELQVLLRAEEAARLSHAATTSGEAYGLFLRATAVYNQRAESRMQEAVGWLEEALRLDPNFARAHSRLAMLAALGTQVQGGRALAERHARLALALDSTLAEPHAVLSLLYRWERRLLESMAEGERAVALDPDDATVRLIYAQNLIMLGYTTRGTEELDRTLALDVLPNALHWRGLQHLVAGELAKAELLFRQADELGLSWASGGMLELARVRRDTAAVAAFLHAEDSSECGGRGPGGLPRSIRLGGAGTPAERQAFFALAEVCVASRSAVPVWVTFYLIQLGAHELAVASLLRPPGEQGVRATGPRSTNEVRWWIWTWSPAYSGVRAAPGFHRLLQETGLIEAWDRFGPPDLCRRIALGEYACS
jgi:TolB-like protein